MSLSNFDRWTSVYSRACQQAANDAYDGVDVEVGWRVWATDAFNAAILSTFSERQQAGIRDGYRRAWAVRTSVRAEVAANSNALKHLA